MNFTDHCFLDFVLFCLVFRDRVSLCNSPGCSGTYFVDQAGLILTVICLPLPPECLDKGMCHPPHRACLLDSWRESQTIEKSWETLWRTTKMLTFKFSTKKGAGAEEMNNIKKKPRASPRSNVLTVSQEWSRPYSWWAQKLLCKQSSVVHYLHKGVKGTISWDLLLKLQVASYPGHGSHGFRGSSTYSSCMW